jgi:uncharacterized membrane protein YfcA
MNFVISALSYQWNNYSVAYIAVSAIAVFIVMGILSSRLFSKWEEKKANVLQKILAIILLAIPTLSCIVFFIYMLECTTYE